MPSYKDILQREKILIFTGGWDSDVNIVGGSLSPGVFLRIKARIWLPVYVGVLNKIYPLLRRGVLEYPRLNQMGLLRIPHKWYYPHRPLEHRRPLLGVVNVNPFLKHSRGGGPP